MLNIQSKITENNNNNNYQPYNGGKYNPRWDRIHENQPRNDTDYTINRQQP